MTLDPQTLHALDAALSEAANKYAGIPAEQYYLHGLWKAREILRALAAEIEQGQRAEAALQPPDQGRGVGETKRNHAVLGPPKRGGLVRTETTTKTFCHCGSELRSFEDFTAHRRQHHLDYWWRAEPMMMQMLEGCMEIRRMLAAAEGK